MKTIWSFDLGKASLGEAVRDLRNHSFPHKASLLLPEDFAETQTAASRRRMMRTREAHKAREAWLDALWRAAGLMPLVGRRVQERDGKWQAVEETPEQETEREEKLEREFPKKGDTTCYNSALLRIKLLRCGEKLEPWQIYKALHSAIQKRGYGRVPWAARDERRTGKTEEEMDKELAKKDPAYKAAVEAWPHFKDDIRARKLEIFERFQPSSEDRKTHGWKDDYYFVAPCYYDAAKMKLWKPTAPETLVERIDCHAESTRRVRFARADVEKEIATLARNAAAQLPALAEMFARARSEGWTLRDEKSGRTKTFPVVAADIGAFLVHGPAGEPLGAAENDFAAYLKFRRDPDGKAKERKENKDESFDSIHPGSIDDWMGATAQKTPRFENRIVEKCALIPRLHVCRAAAKPVKEGTAPDPESLLHCEVAFLMKLKNIRVLRLSAVVSLTARQIGVLLDEKRAELRAAKLDRCDKQYGEKVADIFKYSEKKWANVGDRAEFDFKPCANHEETEAPKCGGRSRFSRPALRLLRALVLSGERPSAFRAMLTPPAGVQCVQVFLEDGVHAPLAIFANCTDAALKAEERKAQDEENGRAGLLVSDLDFLRKMRKADAKEDSWEGLFIPNEKLDGVVEELHAAGTDAKAREKRNEAITELIGEQNDPIVRHRLTFFWKRLCDLELQFGEPQRIVLEFAREAFLGKKAKTKWKKFNDNKREQNERARKQSQGGSDKEMLKLKLWEDQGGECVYGMPVTKKGLCPYTRTSLPSPTDSQWDGLEIDHIVPRELGGPDAYINYVLTFREIANQQKRDRIPYVWFSQDRPDELDGYIRSFKTKKKSSDEHGRGLGKKKIALLTRPDAAELVDRYTALAQTAWISRLAQTIIRLHFGWPLDHQRGEERVLTLTGGQTAQFRRDFRLNSLLGPDAKTTASFGAISKEEDDRIGYEIQSNLMDDMKKNRVDPRHHALDAMVLSVIPEWRHFQAKKWEQWRARKSGELPRAEIMEKPTPFFDAHCRGEGEQRHLDNNSVRKDFALRLAETHAKMVAYERARLEETLYRRSVQQIEKIGMKPLDEMACVHPHEDALRCFDAPKLRRWVKRCVDEKQREALAAFVFVEPTVESWETFKREHRKLFRGGKAKVRALTPTKQYTVRAELRLFAYAGNTAKKDTIFQPAWVREDAGRINTAQPVFVDLKREIETYLAQNPEPKAEDFSAWLAARCQALGRKKILLNPLADENEEADSKRRGESVPPERFGCRQIPLKFDPDRLVKSLKDICDPWIRERIRMEFQIAGEGKKATHREFGRDEWEAFCNSLHKPAKPGKLGARILKVMMLAGNAAADADEDEVPESDGGEGVSSASAEEDEFKESTKTPKAFFKGKAHKGYYLYLDATGLPKRLPVFAHQSRQDGKANFERKLSEQCAIEGSKCREIGFFQTGCNIEIKASFDATSREGKKVMMSAGIYRLNTLNKTRQMKVTGQNGAVVKAQVDVFIEAGLRRAD